MRYQAYHIPTRTFPNKLTKIRDGIFVFKSKKRLGYFKNYSHTICLIIDTQIQTDGLTFLKDYVSILNVFRQEYASVQWLSLHNKTQVDNFDNFENYLNLHFDNPDKPIAYIENFHSMAIHLFLDHRKKYPFIDILNKFSELDPNSFNKRTIQFIAITNPIITTTNKIYENALFESAMLFQAFEAILNEYHPITETNENICPKCKKKDMISIRARIKLFLESPQYLFSKEIISAMMKIYTNRNKFFHHLKGKSHLEYSNDAISKIGNNYISFEDEIKYADATIQAPSILKLIIISVLFDKLGINYT